MVKNIMKSEASDSTRAASTSGRDKGRGRDGSANDPAGTSTDPPPSKVGKYKPSTPESRARNKPKGVHGVPGSKHPDRRCTAVANRTGERCKRAAIKGGTVCTTHGGRLPTVAKAAKDRLQDLVDPFITELRRIVFDEDTEPAVKVRAIVAVLDRTGYGPGMNVSVGVSDFDTMLAKLATDAVVIDRSVLFPETPALGGGGGEHPWTDYEQHARDAQSEAWSDYDHEDAVARERGRIRPDENTVRGEVVHPVQSRYDGPPPRDVNEPPRYVDQEARDADR